MNNAAALLADQIGALWSEGRIELVDTIYAEDVVDHMPVPGQAGGRGGLKQAVALFRAGLPDLRLDLHGTIACRAASGAEWGIDWWSLTGTHDGPLFGVPPTGRRVAFGGIDWVRIVDGRIAELWHVEDLHRMEEALGLPAGPPPGPVPLRQAAPELPAGLDIYEQAVLAVARRHLEDLWAAGDERVAADVYAADVKDMNPAPGQQPGIAGIVEVLRWLRHAAPDLVMHVEAYAVEGRFAADRWTLVGTHSGTLLLGVPATGRRFTLRGMDVVRVNAAGRIDRVWHVEDMAGVRAQLLAP